MGKDVPSRSSEFAHADIAIGLTILAYRHHGLRTDDVRDLVRQLKRNFRREKGMRDRRPSFVRFEGWCKDNSSTLPLDLFRYQDRTQILTLGKCIGQNLDAISYFLSILVFPRTMRFHREKISGSGHELVYMFSTCMGFSGTPSTIIPSDLGHCMFEPGSEGRILDTICRVSSVIDLNEEWNSESLLRHVAKSKEKYRALIDTGALITELSNEQVARKLLDLGLEWCDGVIFLDEFDRKRILVRETNRIMDANQCGVPLERRFVFYDQIHTTGMDIKHTVRATAVITLGKDMVLRDFTQGAYRMRGIGIGQRIHIFVIPEIRAEIVRCCSGEDTGTSISDLMSWLLSRTPLSLSLFLSVSLSLLLSLSSRRSSSIKMFCSFKFWHFWHSLVLSII